MKKLFFIYLIFQTFIGFSQSPESAVFIPKDDGSPFSWPTTTMWVNKKNNIYIERTALVKLIEITTDNGVIDTGRHASIIPAHAGEVRVKTKFRKRLGDTFDTIETVEIFIAIEQPEIIVTLNYDHFKTDSVICIQLIDKKTMQPADKRYQIGRMFEPSVYDQSGKFLETAMQCYDPVIDLHYDNTYPTKIESGFSIHLSIIVRDMETDLLIFTPTLNYQIQ